MPLFQIALVSQTNQLPFSEVAPISAALQKQVTRDFGPIWNMQATVDAFAHLENVPDGYWPIFIRDDIDVNAAGIHSDSNGQPYALVEYNFGLTSLVCSHECLEMLADPFGSRLIAADSIKPGQGRVSYLLEVCDPCQHEENGYPVNNFIVSDFYTPHYFDPVVAQGVRYSFRGTITAPKQVLPKGYVSWMIPGTGEWWQAHNLDGDVTFVPRGKLSRPPQQNWREVIDQNTKEPLEELVASASHSAKDKSRSTRYKASPLGKAKAYGWTKHLRKDIAKVLAKSTARSAKQQ